MRASLAKRGDAVHRIRPGHATIQPARCDAAPECAGRTAHTDTQARTVVAGVDADLGAALARWEDDGGSIGGQRPV
jgi:hypothetical protein